MRFRETHEADLERLKEGKLYDTKTGQPINHQQTRTEREEQDRKQKEYSERLANRDSVKAHKKQRPEREPVKQEPEKAVDEVDELLAGQHRRAIKAQLHECGIEKDTAKNGYIFPGGTYANYRVDFDNKLIDNQREDMEMLRNLAGFENLTPEEAHHRFLKEGNISVSPRENRIDVPANLKMTDKQRTTLDEALAVMKFECMIKQSPMLLVVHSDNFGEKPTAMNYQKEQLSVENIEKGIKAVNEHNQELAKKQDKKIDMDRTR